MVLWAGLVHGFLLCFALADGPARGAWRSCMTLVAMQGIIKTFGGHRIWGPLDLQIEDRQRIGLIGSNGGGKTTLLRVLAGLDEPDEGLLVRQRGLRAAYLPQEVPGDERSVLHTVLAALPEVYALEQRVVGIETLLADPASVEDADRFGALLDEQAAAMGEWHTARGDEIRSRALGYLDQLGFSGTAVYGATAALSGGQRKSVALAACLLSEPTLLLLDEPDTHLDLAHKTQLEGLIRSFRGSVLVVSHDRYLLDETVTMIVELEDGTLRPYDGNYSAFVVSKQLSLLRQEQQFTAQQKEIERLEEAIARFKLWASIVVDERHIKQARNKQRQIDRMDKIERPVLERKRMRLQLRGASHGGQKALEMRNVSMAFGSNIVLLDAKYTFWRGQRVGVLGPNGAGKTVFGKLLAGLLEPTEGEVWQGPSTTIGYYAQGHETLQLDQTLVEAVRSIKPMYEGQAVALLGTFLFPYRMRDQRVGALSGGERSRLQLLRLMIGGANCLVLDEPSNHLDIPSAEVLEDALQDFDGTVIVVSHDRYLLERVVDQLLILEDGGVRHFDGGYSTFLELQEAATAVPAVVQPAVKARRGTVAAPAKKGRGR
ncbi:MAG: ABC-F family ATP-binding cassette domain-containing protein [Herpetosiphon sp.]